MKRAVVLDAGGREVSPCPEEKAWRMVRAGKAELLSEHPLVIQLPYIVNLPRARACPENEVVKGPRILLHICCGPCATYTVKRLRERGWEVTGHWFNPNIHPFSEHERRRETLAQYAEEIGLAVIWEPEYELPAFFRAVVGHERHGERCAICYQLRLERTSRVAGQRGFDALTTTLLISPYQDQSAIRCIGAELAETYGVSFYFENFRRGFAEHYDLARRHGLYMQRYCGCVYSEWEARDRQAPTLPKVPGERH